jgi:hypothetical protein
MRDLWRGERSYPLEPMQIVAEAIEQPLTAAEERGHEVDFHLIHQAGGEILLGGVRSTRERHILAAGGAPGRFERRLDAVGDEREGRSAVELEWLAWGRPHMFGRVRRIASSKAANAAKSALATAIAMSQGPSPLRQPVAVSQRGPSTRCS